MYLKKIELHGFKSFAHKTTLYFDDGITAIVGPNGCGKSNIVDAVRWAVGEQRARALRSEKMENVIFNGTSKRKALGMAEVLLTVENTRGVLPVEFTEVTLGRRLYRSGESEYLLNNIECRLRDIQDLFMDTGMGAGAYSVIELSMVEEILSDNADDRRRLFEEAAGITRYKLRRKQALGKLDSTQHDLTRLRDLTEEIGGTVRSLKRQADRAARFRDYDAQRTFLEKTLLYAEHHRLAAERAALLAAHQQLGDALEAGTAVVATQEAALEKQSAYRLALEGERRARQEALHVHLAELRTLEGELKLSRERLVRLDAERTRLRAELDEGQARRKAQEHVRVRFEDERARAEPRHADAQRVLGDAEKERLAAEQELAAIRAAVQQARLHENTAERALTDARRVLDRLAARAEMQENEAQRLQAEIAGGEQGEHAQAIEKAETQRSAALLEVQQAAAALDDAEAQRDRLEAERRALADARRALESRHSGLDAERCLLGSLIASYEGFSEGVRTLVRHDADLVTVADVLRADDAWQHALSAALGDWSGCVVVQDEQEATTALARLRAENAGQVLLLVQDRLTRPAAASAVPGATALAQHVTTTRPAYNLLRDVLLQGWHVSATLDEARAQAADAGTAARFVTPEGFWASSEGALRGGSTAAHAPAPTRATQRERLATLEAEVQTLDADLASVAVREQALAGALRALDFTALRAQQAQAARMLGTHEQALARARAEAGSAQKQAQARTHRLAELAAEKAKLQDQVAEAEKGAAAAEAEHATHRTARQQAEIQAATREEESRAVFERYNEAALTEMQLRNRVETLRADLDRTTRTIAEMDRQHGARETRFAEVGREREAARTAEKEALSRLEARAAGRQPLEDAVQQAESALLDLQAALSENEKALREARNRRDALVREGNETAVRLAEVTTRLQTLEEDFMETFGAPLGAGAASLPEDFDAPAARAEVQELRRKIAALGSINALALDQYEEEKARLEFLLTQQHDLENAETSLLDTIREINTTAAQRFEETYARIEASFADLFRELFGPEARAELRLADPSDPLESPVDIFAQPGGKRPSALAQLSGGEKTLTAIALLFSIYLVKPSPFCILDEVDAPLDEANVDRFMRLIRRFSDKTQFILVTHNKRTMELSDRLYGVTMQEPGISKTVAVRFEDAVEVAGS